MNKLKLLIPVIMIIAAAVSAVSCKTRQEQRQEVIKIDFSGLQNCNPQELFKITDIIPLDTQKPAIISYVSKVIHAGGNYYISNNNGNVIKFNEEGRYINTIGTIGRGPGEYLTFEDFLVDTVTGNVEILSLMSRKIMIYTPDGNFISSVTTPGYPYSFAKSAGGYIFGKGPTQDDELGYAQVYRTGSNGELISKFLYTTENSAYQMPMKEEAITVCGKEIFYKMWLSPDIYRIDETSAAKTVGMNMGNYGLDSAILSYSSDKFMEALYAKKFYTISKFLKNGDNIYIFFADNNGDNFLHLLYNTKNNKTYIFDNNSSVDGFILSGEAKYFTPDGELVFIAPGPDSITDNYSVISLRILQ